MGGTLSRPADQFPGTFDTPFWRRFPYFLPSLIGASFTVLIIILVALFLKEVCVPYFMCTLRQAYRKIDIAQGKDKEPVGEQYCDAKLEGRGGPAASRASHQTRHSRCRKLRRVGIFGYRDGVHGPALLLYTYRGKS